MIRLLLWYIILPQLDLQVNSLNYFGLVDVKRDQERYEKAELFQKRSTQTSQETTTNMSVLFFFFLAWISCFILFLDQFLVTFSK